LKTIEKYSFHYDPDCRITGWMEPAHVKIKLNPTEFIQEQIFRTGGFEKDTIAEIIELLPNVGGVFIDIGANIGIFSLNICRKASMVYAFEATQDTCELLSETIRENDIKNIILTLGAIHSDDNKEIEIYSANSGDSGSNSIYYGDRVLNTVKTMTIDAFVKNNNISRIDIIKIDIEGNELNALKGAFESIKKFRPVIVCEINPELGKKIGHPVGELYDYLCGALLYIAKVPAHTNKFKKLSRNLAISFARNVFFFPK
jgi:FkbM family methyltransferase